MACVEPRLPSRPASLDDSKLSALLASTALAAAAVPPSELAESLELQPDAPSPQHSGLKPLSRSSSAEQLLGVSSGDDSAKAEEVRAPVTAPGNCCSPARRAPARRRARLGPAAGGGVRLARRHRLPPLGLRPGAPVLAHAANRARAPALLCSPAGPRLRGAGGRQGWPFQAAARHVRHQQLPRRQLAHVAAARNRGPSAAMRPLR
jgi:hypothetical protein